MSGYGPKKTWKIVFVPKVMKGGIVGVALVEADTKQQAMYTFMHEYAGQYHTVESCQELFR